VRVAAAALAVLSSLAVVTSRRSDAVAESAPKGLDAARFADPRPDSRPTVLWFWNGTVTPALVDRQFGELRAQGVYEAIVFPFDTTALKPAFFSAELRREWGHMVTSDLGPQSSLWEWTTTDGKPENGYDSLAHGWSGGPGCPRMRLRPPREGCS
jgi:hypothetical protein